MLAIFDLFVPSGAVFAAAILQQLACSFDLHGGVATTSAGVVGTLRVGALSVAFFAGLESRTLGAGIRVGGEDVVCVARLAASSGCQHRLRALFFCAVGAIDCGCRFAGEDVALQFAWLGVLLSRMGRWAIAYLCCGVKHELHLPSFVANAATGTGHVFRHLFAACATPSTHQHSGRVFLRFRPLVLRTVFGVEIGGRALGGCLAICAFEPCFAFALSRASTVGRRRLQLTITTADATLAGHFNARTADHLMERLAHAGRRIDFACSLAGVFTLFQAVIPCRFPVSAVRHCDVLGGALTLWSGPAVFASARTGPSGIDLFEGTMRVARHPVCLTIFSASPICTGLLRVRANVIAPFAIRSRHDDHTVGLLYTLLVARAGTVPWPTRRQTSAVSGISRSARSTPIRWVTRHIDTCAAATALGTAILA